MRSTLISGFSLRWRARSCTFRNIRLAACTGREGHSSTHTASADDIVILFPIFSFRFELIFLLRVADQRSELARIRHEPGGGDAHFERRERGREIRDD